LPFSLGAANICKQHGHRPGCNNCNNCIANYLKCLHVVYNTSKSLTSLKITKKIHKVQELFSIMIIVLRNTFGALSHFSFVGAFGFSINIVLNVNLNLRKRLLSSTFVITWKLWCKCTYHLERRKITSESEKNYVVKVTTRATCRYSEKKV